MVLNYRAANYSGWPLSRFILYSHCISYTMQSYKKYLNYANISINIFSKLLLKNTKPSNTFSMASEKALESLAAKIHRQGLCYTLG